MEFVFYPKKDFQEKNIRNGKNIKKVIIYGQESNTSEGSKAFINLEIFMSKLEKFLFLLECLRILWHSELSGCWQIQNVSASFPYRTEKKSIITKCTVLPN